MIASLDQRDRHHAAERFERVDKDFATTRLVLAEIDYMAGAHLACTPAIHVAERYRDLDVTLADASLVALAARLGTTRIATFDERHFRAMQPLSGGTAFTLLPADA